MADSAYGSRRKAIEAAQEAMRTKFGVEVRFDPIPTNARFPRSFRVLDSQGHPLERFRVFKTGTGIEEWAWQELAANREL
jgi:hypothetical protein